MDVKPIYIYVGGDELLKREAVAKATEAALAGGIREFNETKLLWKETDGEGVVNACKTMPMMGGRRVVIVKGIDGIKGKDADVLAAYLADPSPMATLIMEGTTVDQRVKWVLAAKKLGVVEKLDPPYASKLPAWITGRVRTRGAIIEPAAATLLGEVVGTDLAGLDEAIERLILYVSVPGVTSVTIKLGDVEACVARTRVHSVFELTDALGKRQAGEATAILMAMIEAREAPIAILGMVARHFRRLWEASDAMASGATKEDVGQKLHVSPYFLNDFVRQARLFSDAEYGRLFDRLFQTDRSLKSSRADPELHMLRLVLDVCAAPNA